MNNDDSLNDKKAQELYKLIYTLKPLGKIKIGFNNSIKSVNRSTALLVVVAKDAVPNCIVEPLPILCEQKGTQYVYVSSKVALGKACGLEIDVIACTIFCEKHEDPTKLNSQILKAIK